MPRFQDFSGIITANDSDLPGALDGVNGTDNSPKLRTIIANAPNGFRMEIPPGHYNFGSTVSWSGKQVFSVRGTQATVIQGNIAGPIWSLDGNAICHIDDLYMANSNTTAGSVIGGQNLNDIEFSRLQINGWQGLSLGDVDHGSFKINCHDCIFKGPATYTSNSIGFFGHFGGGCLLTRNSFNNFAEAIRASGVFGCMYANYMEVNHIGMNLGVDPAGSDFTFNGDVAAIHSEANDIGLRLNNVTNSNIRGGNVLGHNLAPGGISQNGMRVGQMGTSRIECITFSGYYGVPMGTDACVVFERTQDKLTLDKVVANNSASGSGILWDPDVSPISGVTFVDCNFP